MDKEGFKKFISDNLFAMGTFVVMIIIGWTTLGSRVTAVEGHVNILREAHAAEVSNLEEGINECKETDSKILIQLGVIETKLDLLLEGRIEND